MAQATVDVELSEHPSSPASHVSSVKTKSSAKNREDTRGSSSKSKLNLKDMDKRISDMESSMKNSLSQILASIANLSQQHTGGACTSPKADRSERENTPPGRCRPMLSLNNGIDEDIVSLHPRDREIRDLYGLEGEAESIASSTSGGSVRNQFSRYTEPDMPMLLGELFGEPIDKSCSDKGIILDDSQINLLKKSWRAEAPERVSSFKEEYRQAFPIHEKSAPFLHVPGLDDLLEPMLAKRHGAKLFKPWGKSRQLCTQPLKSIETLGYQGQLASRMSIIAIAYMQQGLGSLLKTLQEKDVNIDRAVQNVKDLFDMSNKALDQTGRSGLFHHMVRRKAAISDSGLATLKDIQSKVMLLPLSGEGVFGPALQDKLKCRKEQKEQLSDLVPEFFESRPLKRKMPQLDTRFSGTTSYKQPRFDAAAKSRGRQSSYTREFRPRFKPEATATSRPKDKEGQAGQGHSFRIPKKQ